MRNLLKTDPAITFDHMHPDESVNTAGNKTGNFVIIFLLEAITILALLGFMILLMN